MRVNVYAEEMTDRVEIIAKEIDGHKFTGLRFYLELPATVNGVQHQAPFMHRPGDDDSSAVTFWGKRDLREVLKKALKMLDDHYAEKKPCKLHVEIVGTGQSTESEFQMRTGRDRPGAYEISPYPHKFEPTIADKRCAYCGRVEGSPVHD